MGDERIRELERAAAGGDPAAQAALSQARRREGQSAQFPSWRALWDQGADLFAQANLGAGIDGLLDADLEPLGTAYAARVRRFVEDGSDPAVLDALARDAGVGAGMEFGGRDADHNHRPRDVLCALREPAALVRLGLVYDALGAPGAAGADPQGGVPGWLIALVLEATRLTTVPAVFFAQRCSCVLAWPTVEAMLASSRSGVAGVLRLLLGMDGSRGTHRASAGRALRSCAGLGEALRDSYADYVREALLQEGTQVATVCELIRRQEVPLQPFVKEIAVAATASSSSHSSAWALAMLADDEPGASEPLRAAFLGRLEHSQADVRWQAVRCLERFRDSGLVPALQRVAAEDRSDRVRRAAEAALCTLPAVELDQHAPPGPELPPLEPLGESLAGRLNTGLLREGVSGGVRSAVLEWLSRPDPWPSATSQREHDAEHVFAGGLAGLFEEARDAGAHAARLRPFVQGLRLPLLVRFLRLTGHLQPGTTPLALPTLDLLAREACQRADGRYDLEPLAEALPYAGLGADCLGRGSLEPDTVRSVFSSADGWDPTAYFRKRPQLIDEALRGGLTATAGIHVWAARLLAELERVLLAMPSLETSWVEALVDLGTNTAKAKREFAQRVVDAHGVDLAVLLVPQLSARKGDRRTHAARWLARRGVRGALPALREAVAGERFPKVERALGEALAELEQG